jgi:hypothetical protein
MGGWMEGKAGLRIAYSNQQTGSAQKQNCLSNNCFVAKYKM